MHEATAEPGCLDCGGPLTRKSRGPAPTYCSANCRARAKDKRARLDGRYAQELANARAETAVRQQANARPCPYCAASMTQPRRTQCGAPDCKRRYNTERMRKLQLKHKAETGQWLSDKYGRKKERTCIQCGKRWMSGQPNAKYCSNTCQAEREHGDDRMIQADRTGILKRRRARRRLVRAAKRSVGTTPFVVGPCGSCGKQLASRHGEVRWCSKACKARQRQARRRARKREAYVADISPIKIFERDKWRCQLCRKPVARTKVVPHPKAPVIDHVIPLAKGGTHEPANAQTAHFMCNSIKSDRGGGEQLMLIG